MSTDNTSNKPSREFRKLLKHILGFKPGIIRVYQIAFTHSSAKTQDKQDNERLELLGDAVLDLIITEYIFLKYPLKGEGDLTELRSKLVSRKTLNKIGSSLGLAQIINSNLSGNILSTSSALGNAFEALIGAIYLDKGLKKAAKFYAEQVLKVHMDITELEQKVVNFKSLLINHAQGLGESVSYNLVQEIKNGNFRKFKMEAVLQNKIVGAGEGVNKKSAEQSASKEACIKLGLLKEDGSLA